MTSPAVRPEDHIDDWVAPGCTLLFVGVNPPPNAVDVQIHFVHPTNRFYPALHRAGITAYRLAPTAESVATDRAHLADVGVGITSLVARPTRRADELSVAELRAAVPGLERRVERIAPEVVAMTGITAFRSAFRRPRAVYGAQGTVFGGAALWVVPNPSGLNRSTSLDELSEHYAAAALAAGCRSFARTGRDSS